MALGAEVVCTFRRLQICGLCPRLSNQLWQNVRILQHRTRPERILVKWLAVVISHKDRRMQNLQQLLFFDVGIGIVDEYARLRISVCVDMEVVPATSDTAAHIFAVVLEVKAEQTFAADHISDLPDAMIHKDPLLLCRQ